MLLTTPGTSSVTLPTLSLESSPVFGRRKRRWWWDTQWNNSTNKQNEQVTQRRVYIYQGRIQDFKLGGAHLKKLSRAEGGAKMFGGISCEKSRFYAKKIIFFPILGGGALDPPLYMTIEENHNWERKSKNDKSLFMIFRRLIVYDSLISHHFKQYQDYF
jgi:hypothetical protein